MDPTTIRLFIDILKGIGRNLEGDGKKKGGMKVHMLIDAVQSVGRFIKITATKIKDQKLLRRCFRNYYNQLFQSFFEL